MRIPVKGPQKFQRRGSKKRRCGDKKEGPYGNGLFRKKKGTKDQVAHEKKPKVTPCVG